ncbi:GEM-like protein 4 [Papaver somniferum]|nr:GEM-like protein 4 [Papaver somniferum]
MKNRIPDSVLEIKLRLGGGGMRKIFKQTFNVEQGEELLKVSRCYLSTTAGPIAGLLFVSTHKIAFCSEKSLTIPSTNGGLIRTPYKVVVPIEKIKRVEESQNVDKRKQKYIEIVTIDHFDFWFMGFVNYEKAFKCLQRSINISQQQSL